jgi:hypothetical protein
MNKLIFIYKEYKQLSLPDCGVAKLAKNIADKKTAVHDSSLTAVF